MHTVLIVIPQLCEPGVAGWWNTMMFFRYTCTSKQTPTNVNKYQKVNKNYKSIIYYIYNINKIPILNFLRCRPLL